MSLRLLLITSALLLGTSLVYCADSWPHMRGPSADGHIPAAELATTWSETNNITWKTPLPGVGWSSPVISDGAIWMTTAEQDGKSLRALKVDANTGKLLLNVEIFAVTSPAKKHDRNSHASPTPVLANGRVYVHFGTMGTACLNAVDGTIVWANTDLHVDFDVGAGGSPTLYRDLLLITYDGMDVQYQVGLDINTGAVRWKTERSASPVRLANLKGDLRKAFGTPVIFNIDGKDVSINTASHRVYAYDPLTGKELWFVDYKGFSNASMPVYNGSLLIFNTGFPRSEVYAIDPHKAQGDVTKTHVRWTQKCPSCAQTSPIIVDDLVYVCNDSGILSVFEIATGKQVYKERLGVDFAASPIYANGLLYYADARGTTTVLKPGRTFTVVATNELPDGCMASPAVLGNSLFLRTKTALYRIDTK